MTTERLGAVVTGGSGAIGGAVARLLVDRGYRVTLAYSTGESRAKQLAAALGNSCQIQQADITDADDVGRLVNAANEWAPLDVVVNCAGAVNSGLLVRQGPDE